MITRAVVTRQLDVYRSRVEQAIEDITEDEARRVVAGCLAPIVWQVGHLAVVDSMYVQRAGGTHAVPPRYSGLFKPGTGGEAEYPALRDVWTTFSEAHRALLEVVAEADFAKQLEHPAGAYVDVGGMLVHACYHRGYHIGKMSTLRALLGKPIPDVWRTGRNTANSR